MRITKYSCLPLLFAALCGVPIPASAANVSFTGAFTADDQMAIFSFVASASSPVINTTSYAAGGFNTDLALFGPDTSLKAITGLIGQDANGLGDSQIDTAAPPILIIAGDMYWVVLTVFDNSANGPTFGAGFHEAGNGNFSDAAFGCGGNAPFCDPNTLSNLNGNFTLNINGVASAQSAVPEPATFLMVGMVLAGVLAARRLKSAARQSS